MNKKVKLLLSAVLATLLFTGCQSVALSLDSAYEPIEGDSFVAGKFTYTGGKMAFGARSVLIELENQETKEKFAIENTMIEEQQLQAIKVPAGEYKLTKIILLDKTMKKAESTKRVKDSPQFTVGPNQTINVGIVDTDIKLSIMSITYGAKFVKDEEGNIETQLIEKFPFLSNTDFIEVEL